MFAKPFETYVLASVAEYIEKVLESMNLKRNTFPQRAVSRGISRYLLQA